MSNKKKQSSEKAKSKQTTSKNAIDLMLSKPYAYAILVILGIVIYAQTFTFTIGKLDEDHLITFNLKIFNDFSNVKTALTTDAFFGVQSSNFYRPVQNLSYFVDGYIGGGASWVFYLTNVLLHLGTVLVLLKLLKELKIRNLIAFSLSFFWLTTPLFTHSVAWLPARGDLIIGLAGATGLLSLIKFNNEKKFGYLLLNILSVGIAIFSKETGILLPVLLVAFVMLQKGRKFNVNHITALVSYVIFAAVFLSLRSNIASTDGTGQLFNFNALILNLRVIPEYLIKFVVPLNLAPMPQYTLPDTVLGLIVLILMVYFFFSAVPKGNYTQWYGLIWFLAFVIPGAMYRHLFKDAAYDYLEHRSYLPLIGIVISIAYLLNFIKAEQTAKKMAYVITALSAVYIVISMVILRDYSDPLTYYNTAIKENPGTAMAHYNRGILLKKDGKEEAALADYEAALQIKPDYSEVLVNRGAIYKEKGMFAQAQADFENALKYKRDLPEAWYNVAMIEHQKGNENKALEYCGNALGYNKNLWEVYMLIGNIYFGRNETAKAIDEYSKALVIKTDDAGLYNNRGSAEFIAGKYTDAVKDFDMAISLKPDYADAYKNRGLTKNALKDKAGACSDFEKSASLGNKDARNLQQQICN